MPLLQIGIQLNYKMDKIKFLLLVLLLSVMPDCLWAYTVEQIISFDGGETTYKVLVSSGTNASVRFIGSTKSGVLDIPSTISNNDGTTFTVTEVGYQAGYSCRNITSVKLPETVTKLGNDCFRDAKLTEINIPKSITEISEWAWSAINEVPKCKVVSDNPKFESDSEGALYTKGKKELRSIPSQLMKQKGSDTYTVDTNVKKICVNAFHNIFELKTIVLPKDLEEVQEKYPSIAINTDLEKFEMPNNGNENIEVKEGVLFNKKTHTLVCYPRAKNSDTYKVPDDIKRIAPFAMMVVKNMTSLDLNKVETLERSALYKPQKLKTITIPKELKKGTTNPNHGLQDGAFEECVALEEYKVADGNPDFCDDNGVLYSKNKEKLYFYPLAKNGENYTIPNTVKEISQKAFQGATHLKAMTIPNSVDSIGIEAFRNMLNLETVTFEKPAKVRTLNNDVFRACKKLKEAVLPASITTLGSAFYECEALEKVTVPDASKLKTIKTSAFATNKKLKKFEFEGSCDLTTIGSNAFANAEKLELFKFPKSVTKIELNAFSGCKSMTTVEFDKDADIKVIGEGAFADCGLKNISIPKKVEKIEKEAFRKCEALTKIDVTEATKEIHPLAFQYCGNLNEINVAKENEKYSSVDGYLLSKDKKELVLFPPGKANSMFTLLPPSIEKIGDYSFYNCEKLTNVTIPNRVKAIGKRAFSLCKVLNTVTFLCDNMIPVANINTNRNEMSFDNGQDAPDMFANITINVRKERMGDYQGETTFYNKFKKIEKSFTEGTEEYIAVSENAVDMLSTKRKDHTFVLPTEITHENKKYTVSMIGDFAFQNATGDVKEVVVKKNVTYIGAKAFVTDTLKNESTVKSVFFIENNPTKEMLSTTRFELDETNANYNEFATNTTIYVKKSACETYKKEWHKTVYNTSTKKNEKSKFNFTDQIEYKILDVKINTKYGTFAREFDTDFGIYKKEKGKSDIGAFVAKNSEIRKGNGDYGVSEYHVSMRSVDEKGGVSHRYGYVPANTGVLLKVLDLDKTPDGFYYAIGEEDNVERTITDNIMTGITINPQKVMASATNPVYVMQGGVFKIAKNDIPDFKIHKAYAKIGNIPSGAKLLFSFFDKGSTTEIKSINTVKKIDNLYYNLSGQRVTSPQHGLFIQGGRKVIIK